MVRMLRMRGTLSPGLLMMLTVLSETPLDFSLEFIGLFFVKYWVELSFWLRLFT